MTKKEYIAPAVEVMAIKMDRLSLLTVSGFNENIQEEQITDSQEIY